MLDENDVLKLRPRKKKKKKKKRERKREREGERENEYVLKFILQPGATTKSLKLYIGTGTSDEVNKKIDKGHPP